MTDGSYDSFYSAAGGGAGLPGGSAVKSKNGVEASKGENSSGGLLVVFASKLDLKSGCLFMARGGAGGKAIAGSDANNRNAAAGGGGSGGGSINVFMKEISIENENISSYFNVNGGAGGLGSGGKYNANGGSGGAGSCNVGNISTGSYVSYYYNNN